MSEFKTDLKTYEFNHTMIRTKDPKVSLEFYQHIFGMKLIYSEDYETDKFTHYFLAFVNAQDLASLDTKSKDERRSFTFRRPGVLELTHNWGTENDADFSYANGNKEPGRGFGHISIHVDNVDEACKRLESFGDKIQWIKRLGQCNMKDVAIIADPDGYWIGVCDY